jgi:hypothetical protein
MPKWIAVALALTLSLGVYFSIRYGLRPKPIPQLNPTVFENAEQIGAIAYRALRAQLHTERVVVLGSTLSVKGYESVWNGFVKAAIADRIRIDVVFQRVDLALPAALANEVIRPVTIEDLTKAEFVTEVQSAYQRGQLALIHILSTESTHLLPNTVTRKLQALPNLPVVSISMLPMAVRQEDLEQIHCVDPNGDSSNEDRLGCAASRISRRYLRKRLPHDKWVAAIERHGLKEYLLFVSEPNLVP